MAQPGWHSDPEGSGQLRWWDGRQWTSAVQRIPVAPTPPDAPKKTPQTPEQKRRNYIAAGVVAAVIVAFVGYTAWNDTRSDDSHMQAASTRSETTATSASSTRTERAVVPYEQPPVTVMPRVSAPMATTTTARPGVSLLPPATSAADAGCTEPDPSVLAAIEAALTDGRVLLDVAAASDIINGVQYEYVGANVYRSDGVTRSVSGVVWLSPGIGVVNLSGNSRDVTPGFAFGRGTFGNAGDDAGLKVQDCVSALARGR
ncbi:DUF2510 domain-containing protein [Rhodococcus sp. BP22]|uniref:DUF2510 domain-containing protein n=1 Tax=Rhodococcus sp. BP22 TaxID=2758566 RepID=UPI0016441DBB|nr:DUF2510 domain-containing protein [Rhodococcus sp. BP22]